MMRAPVVIVPCSSKAAYLDRYAEPDKGWTDRDEARWPVPFWHMDAGDGRLLILQTAVDEGLGACFFGIPPDRERGGQGASSASRTTFDPVGAITLGHRVDDPGAAGSPARRPRRPLDDVVHRGSWGGRTDTPTVHRRRPAGQRPPARRLGSETFRTATRTHASAAIPVAQARAP